MLIHFLIMFSLLIFLLHVLLKCIHKSDNTTMHNLYISSEVSGSFNEMPSNQRNKKLCEDLVLPFFGFVSTEI